MLSASGCGHTWGEAYPSHTHANPHGLQPLREGETVSVVSHCRIEEPIQVWTLNEVHCASNANDVVSYNYASLYRVRVSPLIPVLYVPLKQLLGEFPR